MQPNQDSRSALPDDSKEHAFSHSWGLPQGLIGLVTLV